MSNPTEWNKQTTTPTYWGSHEAPPVSLLIETGDYFLLETGFYLVLQNG